MATIEDLKRRIRLADVIGSCIDLKKDGTGLKGLCPLHGESSPSLSVWTDETGRDRWHCFGCKKGGDVIDWFVEFDKMSEKAGIKKLRELTGDDSPLAREPQQPPKKPKYTFVDAPDNAEPPFSIYSHKADGVAKVVNAWAYRSPAGALLGYTCRVEVDGKKEVIPVRWTLEKGWRQKSLDIPRPLYGADLIAQRPDLNCIIAEGEKATDAGRRILGDFAVHVATWAGGCGATHHADWSLLAGQKVLLWPDCDSKRYPDNHPRAGQLMPYLEQPGMAAMLAIAVTLEGLGCDVRIVEVPEPGTAESWPDGHDFADLEVDGWTRGDVLAFITDKARPAADLLAAHAVPDEMPDAYAGDDLGDPPDYTDDDSGDLPPVPGRWYPGADAHLPFKVLGYYGTTYFYYTRDANRVVALSLAAHKAPNLFTLADASWWKKHFPGRRGDASWTDAANYLIRYSTVKGTFNDDHLCGNGAHWDAGRAVVNIGDGLIVDGRRVDYLEHDSENTYISGEVIPVDLEHPLDTEEAVKLLALCQGFRWERPINAHFAAGWTFIAPIGGALDYRPSIWPTGSSGVGKTTLQTKVIRPCLGRFGLFCASSTTEAGLRQKLGNASIPVQFDEFESTSQKEQQRTTGIESLVIQGATDDGAGIYKGGADGNSIRYQARSMFCFSSITVDLASKATASRITALGMLPALEGQAESFKKLKKLIAATLTPAYVAALQARAIRLIPVIRHNGQVFAQALNEKFHDARMGDQYGTLLAGSYALHSSKEITLEAAIAWIESQDWTEERHVVEEGDELRLINYITGQSIRLSTEGGVFIDYNIGELIEAIRGQNKADGLSIENAKAGLARFGLKVDIQTHMLQIANQHPKLARILKDTEWSTSWPRTLARIPGAQKNNPSIRFAGTKARFVAVPFEVLD